MRTNGKTASWLSLSETGKALNTSTGMVKHYVRQGLLSAHYPDGLSGNVLFSATEVSALNEVRGNRVDLAGIANVASRALARVKVLEGQVEALYRLLGEVPTLPTDEPDILTLVEEARVATRKPKLDAESITAWAHKLLAIDENYFDLLEITAGEDSWRIFLDLANLCVLEAPQDRFVYDKPLATAYALLDTARRHLRAVVFVSLVIRHGRKEALKAVRPDQSEVDELLTLAKSL